MPSALLKLIAVGAIMTAFFSIPHSASSQSHPRGMIGLGATDAQGRAGAVIGVITPGGPADRAGVHVGDLVTALNGSPVSNSTTFTAAIRQMSPGETARLSILRGSQRLTLNVVIDSPDGSVPGASTNHGSSSEPVSPASAARPANIQPLSVSGYSTFTDPIEHAFTMQAPSGWKTIGGMARRAALQINPFLRSLSPDRMTYLIIGEPTLPTFTPPNQTLAMQGHGEGYLYWNGLSGLALVRHYMSGSEFSQVYGQSVFQGLCTNLRFTGSRERSDMAANADRLVPPVAPSISTGGEARFTCTHGGQEMEARMQSVTRVDRNHLMWNVIFLKGFLAPRSQADKAQQILDHVGASFTYDSAWSQRQSNIDAAAAAAINRNLQQYFRQEQGVIANLNATDENFSAMDDIVSGYSNYRDPATGSVYKLSNTNPNKWYDPATGRIVSTPTNSAPIWGNYQPMQRVP